MNTKILSSCILLLGICLLGSTSLRADLIPYGDFAGDNVNFLMVQENSAEVGPLYGAPTVDGDALEFLLPPGFVSQSEDGGVDFLDGALSFTVEANGNGLGFNSISVDEFGAFFDFGDASTSSVTAIAFVVVDGQIYNGQFDFSNTGGGNGPGGADGGPWIEGLTINFPTTTEATFFLDNQLLTSADDGGVAFIDKKYISIEVGVVPEPASGMLLLGGMCVGLATLRRRKS